MFRRPLTIVARLLAVVAMFTAAIWVTVVAHGNLVFATVELKRQPPYRPRYGLALEGGGVHFQRFVPATQELRGPPFQPRTAPEARRMLAWMAHLKQDDRVWNSPGVSYSRMAIIDSEGGIAENPLLVEGYRTELRVHYWLILAIAAPLPLCFARSYLKETNRAGNDLVEPVERPPCTPVRSPQAR